MSVVSSNTAFDLFAQDQLLLMTADMFSVGKLELRHLAQDMS
jgi:hypothetical protein